MKFSHCILVLGFFFVLSSSTCNKNESTKTNTEIDGSSSTSADATTTESTQEIAGEIRDEIEEEASKDSKADEVTALCGKDLESYQKNMDILLAINKKRAKEGESEEIDVEIKAVNAKLKELGEKMSKNTEMFMNPECAAAWVRMSSEYAKYVTENISDFVPTQK